MVYTKKHDSVYYIYDNGEVWYFNLDNQGSKFIQDIVNATSLAIDDKNNKVYVGSTSGLYKINTNTNLAYKTYKTEPILSVCFKDDLYFTNKHRKVYKNNFYGGKMLSQMLNDVADDIVLDNENNLFFMKDRKVYRIKLDAGTPAIEVTDFPVNFMTMDEDDKLYLATDDGILLYNKYRHVLDKITKLYANALVFDKRRYPVYCVTDSLFRLKDPVDCIF